MARAGGDGRVVYLDTSAAIKLVRPEVHSSSLSRWLGDRGGSATLSSVLIEIESLRATRRSAPERTARAAAVLRGVGVVTLSPSVIARVTAYADPLLRSLDAVHLATAEHVMTHTGTALEAFVTYDERLLAAARSVGLPVVAPGITTAVRD